MPLTAEREKLRRAIEAADAVLKIAPLPHRVIAQSIAAPLIDLLQSLIERIEKLEKDRQP